MAEEIYIDEFDLTPEPEEIKEDKDKDKKSVLPKEIPVPGLGEEPGKLTATDVLFGPDVELQGDSFLAAGKLGRRIKERLTGEEVTDIGEVDPFTGFVAGVIDGTIKIPYGIVNLTAEIADALREDDVPVDKGYVAQLEKYFGDSVLGRIQQGAEDVVKETAIGKLTSALTQLYTFGRAGASAAVKASEKAKQIYNKWSMAAKANKVAKASPNATKAAIRAKELNKLTGLQKFAAVTVGGATGSAMVADVEDIGTWGDLFGGPSELDREVRPEAEDDAARKLYNRFKFGVEGGVVSVPIAYGINKIAKRIAEAGKNLKYSDDKLDRWIDKYVAQPLDPEEKKNNIYLKVFEKLKVRCLPDKLPLEI